MGIFGTLCKVAASPEDPDWPKRGKTVRGLVFCGIPNHYLNPSSSRVARRIRPFEQHTMPSKTLFLISAIASLVVLSPDLAALSAQAASVTLPIPARLQWANYAGYCGETSLQMAWVKTSRVTK